VSASAPSFSPSGALAQDGEQKQHRRERGERRTDDRAREGRREGRPADEREAERRPGEERENDATRKAELAHGEIRRSCGHRQKHKAGGEEAEHGDIGRRQAVGDRDLRHDRLDAPDQGAERAKAEVLPGAGTYSRRGQRGRR
jgi:hypothetical protein